MPACLRHPKFNIAPGIYFRSADPGNSNDWTPKNQKKASDYYKVATGNDLEQLAEIMGEAQMQHSNESSVNSPFVSVARCPVCLAASTDPTVQSILNTRRYLCRLDIGTRNQSGFPYIFEITGLSIGAQETEALALIPGGSSLLTYHDGYVTLGYINSMR